VKRMIEFARLLLMGTHALLSETRSRRKVELTQELLWCWDENLKHPL